MKIKLIKVLRNWEAPNIYCVFGRGGFIIAKRR